MVVITDLDNHTQLLPMHCAHIELDLWEYTVAADHRINRIEGWSDPYSTGI